MKFFLKNFEEIISGLFLTATVIIVILNVFLRYVFNTGFIWVNEVSTACFVWSVFIGSAAAYKTKMHIGIDVLLKFFSLKKQLFINIIVDFLMILISGYLVYLSVIFIENSYLKVTPVLGISSAYVSSSILIGFLLICFYSIKFFLLNIKRFLEKDVK